MTSGKGNATQKAEGAGICKMPTPQNTPTSVDLGNTTAFATHQEAALAVLLSGAQLRRNEGQFLGGLAFDANPMSDKQANWLDILLDRHGLPPFIAGGNA